MHEAAHQLGIVPLAVMLLLGRWLPFAFWLVAAAFAMSWAGDSWAYFAGGSWAGAYVWLPAQFALVLLAVQPEGGVLMGVLALAALTLASVVVSWPGPEWVVTLGGSVMVLVYARRPLALPLYVYFGAGSVAYLWLILTLDNWQPAWLAYQACRLAAVVAFTVVVWREGGGWKRSPKSRRA